MKKIKKGPSELMKRATLATGPKASRSSQSTKKPMAIQTAICEFAEQGEELEWPMNATAILTRFCLYLEKNGFAIIHWSEFANGGQEGSPVQKVN